MKLSIVWTVASAAFISQTLATPAPQPPTYYCEIPSPSTSLQCPVGYRCCPPNVSGGEGICILGTTGPCPA